MPAGPRGEEGAADAIGHAAAVARHSVHCTNAHPHTLAEQVRRGRDLANTRIGKLLPEMGTQTAKKMLNTRGV